MRQYAGFGDAKRSNERYRYLLGQGQTGLSVAFDLPTQMGLDSDAEAALGEVGRVGVAIDSIDDVETLFDGIDLERVSTSFTINSTASTVLAMYIAVANQRGLDAAKLRGTVQNDILKEYIARGTYIYPPRPSMRLVTDLFAFCTEHTPRFNTVSISGYHIREAGSTAAQELAFTIANGLTYVEAALAVGLELEAFAPRLAFFFNVHNDFFEEIAKFRAARQLWAELMAERFGATSDRARMLRFHAQVAGSTLTAQQPQNNVVRVALQALAAVLGGTQSLHTNAMDEALALPTEETARTALRTQQIIAHETGVANVADPLGGSYLVESLTDGLICKARELIAEIDDLGGMVNAIEEGLPQREIDNAAYATQQAIERGEQIVVGVNDFLSDSEDPPELHQPDPEIESQQRQRLAERRAARPPEALQRTLAGLRRSASSDANVMAAIFDAVKAKATIGEISTVLAEVFGTYSPNR